MENPNPEPNPKKKMKRCELLQLKKEYLLAEYAILKEANAVRDGHRWRVRFYLGTITAVFFGLSIIKSENTQLVVGETKLLFLGIVLVIIFALYDLHVTDLYQGLVSRTGSISKLLHELPYMTRAKLLEIETHISTRDDYLKLPRFERYFRKFSHSRNFDFLLFFGSILAFWIITYLINCDSCPKIF